MNPVFFFLGLLVFSLSFAAWKGGGPERLAAAIYLAATIASSMAGSDAAPGRGFRDLATPLLTVDVAMALALTALTVRANRLWLIAASACQWIAVLAHIVRAIQPNIIPTSYAFLAMIWSWPMVGLLLGGTVAYRRRLTAGVPVPDWRHS
ncbi:hypothetical protein [Sphingomonas sp. LHG3406-1]|uniref:hypothetical protein n=1 Tax=Sphingomonas sp. LHG3406-1 TaxID=2804617 RepID=UPI00260378E4|nr:hypothetical protein [Sphingomonas sp. LHG3406-1]